MGKRGFALLTGIFFLLLSISIEAQIADGSLVKGSNDAVYIIGNGKACWISGENIFNLLGLDWKNVKKISDSELKSIPKDWLIVKGNEKAVYIINYGKAFRVTDASTLKLLGFEKTFVYPVSEEKLKKITQQPLLIKGNDAAIYLLNNGKISWIPGEPIFKALGYDSRSVIKVGDEKIAKFGKTPLLIRGNDQKIYLVDKDKRYWITSATLFNKLGYDWNYIFSVSDSQLKNITEGEPIR